MHIENFFLSEVDDKFESSILLYIKSGITEA